MNSLDSKGLQIAFFGSSLLSAYKNSAATYFRGIIRVLNACGHRVTFYEPDIERRQQHRDISYPNWAKVIIYPADDMSEIEYLLSHAGKADLVIKASGIGVFDQALESSILSLKSPTRSVIFWDMNATDTLDRLARNPDEPFRSLIPAFDLILTRGGGESVISAYKAFGARDCVPIHNAVEPAYHFPVLPVPLYTADLCFLGNYFPDRESRLSEFFFKPASHLSDRRFLLGGSGWNGKLLSANIRCLGHVFTDEHNAFNSSSKAVLNVTRQTTACYGFSPAARIFEAAGAGACVISDDWTGIEQFLEPGSEILVARDGDEVTEIVGSLSRREARRIGGTARRRILAHHTYMHRVRYLEKVLDAQLIERAEAMASSGLN